MPTSDAIETLAQSGPEAVNSELANRSLTYGQFAEVLQQPMPKKTSATDFLLGYLLQQAEKNQQALSYYTIFLDSKNTGNEDMRYFAQWQIAILQQTLGEPWWTVEGSYLKAIEWDPTRAEALKNALVYRYRKEEWRIAHIYSSYCIDQFLEKPPVGKKWLVDYAFYHWEILRYHIPILIVLRKKEEAKVHLYRLLNRQQQNPKVFTDKDRQGIAKLEYKVEEMLSEKI